jgi:NNP family nitrate/nitrite transporter-like MFS transporter
LPYTLRLYVCIDELRLVKFIHMSLKVVTLWKPPEVNPVNHKARSIPGFNPIDKYGRVFFFSWWGFLVAFWSW